MRMGTGRRNRRQPDQNRRKREGSGQAWGQRVRQRALALCLCAVMLLGQTTPVLAAEVTGGAGESTVVRRWSWIDQENLIAGDGEGGYTLAVAGEYSAEEPLKQEQIRENLPSQILAEVEKTASEGEPAQSAGEASEPAGSGTETGDRQPSATEQQAVETKTVAEAGTETETLNLTWDLSSVPETGIYAGNYELNAALPEGYVLADGAPALKIRLEMDSPNTQRIPEAVLEKNRKESTTPVNTKLNLFDYWVYDDQISNDWIKQDELKPPYSSHTAGINKGHPLLFGNGMGSYSNKYYYGLWNTTGTSWNDVHVDDNHSWMEGIVSNRLGADGMPQINKDKVTEQNLATKVQDAWDKNPSLGYLFDPSKEVAGRAVYKNVRNLFLLDNGNYQFHSSDNYAQFVEDRSTQDSDGYFHVYNTWAVKNGNHGGGNFAPFNTAQQLLKENGKGGLVNASIGRTQNQRGSYTKDNSVDGYNKNATSAGTTAEDITINHYLGATMETSFIQPENGMVKGTSNDPGDPMTFSFTGDNDVWIFIDDVLVGDLGGLHSESFITIDFSTGYIYRGPVKKNGTLPSLDDLKKIFPSEADGKEEQPLKFLPAEQPEYYSVNNSKLVFSRTTIKSMHDAANDDTQTWREGGYTYGDDTIHTLKFFYLERGGYDTNLSLDFNLVSVPHSAITKVDQDSDPVVGAEFALYAASYDEATKETKIRKDYNGGEPICTAATDREGRIMLVNDKRQIIQFDKLKENYNVTDYILRETKTPLGYRSRGDVALYYDNGIVLVRNYLTSGAYSSPILNVTMDNKLYDLDKPGELLLDTTSPDRKGIIFAVPLKLDSSMAGNFDKENENLASKLHPISGNFSDGWTVMAEGADLLHSREDKEAIVAAAKSYQEVAEKNSRNVYALTLDNIPGAAQKQYWYVYKKAQAEGRTGEELEQYVRENTGYIVGFYYVPDVRDIEKLTADTEIYRILDTNFETKFTSQLHIPNSFNRLRAQKMDYHGNAVAGATIGLYQIYSEHDHDGTGDQYLPVKVYGKLYYINTQMFDLTDEDKALIRQGAENDNPVEVTEKSSDGTSINEKKKTYARLKADWDKGEGNRTITPWDWGKTKEKSFVKNLELNGTMSFPSAYDSERSVEDKNDIYDVKDTHTYLEVGYYLMCELEAPNNNYVLNETLVPVEVTADNIYANAGEEDNGVRVGMYVGFPQGTMKTLAQEDAMDATLTFLNVQLKRIKERKPDGTWDSEYDDILEGLSTYQYKYDNTLEYYQRYVQEGGSAYHMKAAANLYLFTSEGHPMLRVEQDDSKQIYTFTLKNNYKDKDTGNTNRNGKLILWKEKKGGDGTSITRQVVNVSNGCATFRLAEDEEVSKYFFLQSASDNAEGSGIAELYPDTVWNPDGDFVISQPQVDKSCAGQDISRIFASSTLVQFFDLDQGDMTVKVVVDKPIGKEDKPFYFRLYALYDKVTEIQLFDPKTKEKSTFTGTLNVRIGLENAAGGGITTGEYDETETRTVPVEFKNGLGKLLLSEDYNVKTVRIPENEGHGAHGLVAFIPYQIQLTGDKADYTGKLTVSARSVASGNQVKDQSIAFANGQAVYYAANATKITDVKIPEQSKRLDFTATSQWATANANELFSESPLRKVNVTFHTEGATRTDIITRTSGENGATEALVDVTEENGKYYLTLEAGREGMQTNPFLGGKAVTADFALYDGQSVTIENLPGGITYFVQEWSLGESTKETQYNENINEAYQYLTEKYSTSAEPYEEPKGEPLEYEPEFRTAKRQLQIDLTQKTLFHNVRVLGGLTIEKKVAGNAGDQNRPFTFTVELNPGMSGTYGDVEFKDGEGTIQLKHGQRAVITGLKAGTICTVKEEISGDYETTYAQHQQNEAGNETEIKPEGTAYPATGVEAKIAEDTQNVLTFTNRKDMVIDTGIDLDRTPYILMLAFTGAGLALFFGKKRKRGRNKIQF